MRTEFYFGIFSKQFLCKLFQCTFQISKSNIFVNNKSFNLME